MASFSSSASSTVTLADAGAKCNTCRAAFSGIEKVKEHYRSEWHILNSKRRASNLMPLTKAEFKALGIAAPAKKSAAPAAAAAPVPVAPIPAAPARASKKIKADADAAEEGEEGEEEEGDEEEEGGDEEDVEVLPVAPTISIFDAKEFATVDECVEYMAIAFGFFIPDAEYLVDLEGFLQYLGEKVKLGGFCLYCQRQMKPGRPCQVRVPLGRAMIRVPFASQTVHTPHPAHHTPHTVWPRTTCAVNHTARWLLRRAWTWKNSRYGCLET